MRLTSHALWPLLLPFVSVEDCSHEDGKRFRLELRRLPTALLDAALSMQVGCVACGQLIHPIRNRKPPKNRRSESVGQGLYLAVACPLAVSIGCSRGHASSDEYLRIRAAVDAPGLLLQLA